MRTLLILLLTVTFAFGFTAPISAQCAPIPGTGCPGQTNPVCGTPPMIGTNFIFRCPPTCFPSVSQLIILGVPLGAPVPLPSPPMCVAGCFLACQPMVLINAPGLTIPIPNNPGLVGAQLCIQCLCQPVGAACFTISQGTLVTVM